MKNVAKVLVVLLALFSGFQFYESCRAKKNLEKFYISRDLYNSQVAAQEKRISDLMASDKAKDATNLILEAKAQEATKKAQDLEALATKQAQDSRDLKAENLKLKSEASAVINNNPAVKALIDNYEKRCAAYEAQIFTLAQKDKEKDKAIESQGLEIANLKTQVVGWKTAYTDEHGLRLKADLQVKELLSYNKSSEIWATIGKYGPPIAFVLGIIAGK